MKKEITEEEVNVFLAGHDPMERIVSIECGYNDEDVSIIYINDKGEKRIRKDGFKPFIWVKHSAAIRMFNGNRNTMRAKLMHYGIAIKVLKNKNEETRSEDVPERLANGYIYMFKAERKMTYQNFMLFFSESGVPIYGKKNSEGISNSNKEYLSCTPIEQYMIATGKRMFKGYENYDELHRMSFDIETQGLNPRVHRIEQIGIRTNRGFEKVISIEGKTEEEKDKNEILAIDEMLRIIAEQKPDTIFGHNTEAFDWVFIMERCKILGYSFEAMSERYFTHTIYKKKKETVLKLGGEVEYFNQTIIWGHNVLDSLHAARRAQAIDSSMKLSNLKYVTKYLGMNKPNRVYVKGTMISTIWHVNEEKYAFNNENGDWYEIKKNKPLKEGYEAKSGRYIVERYLLDDIWEADKVELALNEANFLVSKILPTSFQRACTMGTAGIWKLIMLAWSYENDLAIPATEANKKFTGGLSRLLVTGYVPRIVKLDYNSLYPSIMLSWGLANPLDMMRIMLYLLEYILTQREKYKGLKAEAGAKADELKESLSNEELSKEDIKQIKLDIVKWKAIKKSNDKKQLPLKILGNSYFGSAGCPSVFPWGDIDVAEATTCIGRQCLRLMISHFTNLGYTPVVGDSFTEDTPVYLKLENGDIAIRPISSLIDTDNIMIDKYGREYDYTEKSYKVLCRSGWISPSYIYRHVTNKDIYEVTEDNMECEITKDHSLFNSKKEKIKPTDISEDTEFEYYKRKIKGNEITCPKKKLELQAKGIMNNDKNGIIFLPTNLLNLDKESTEYFLSLINEQKIKNKTKSIMAGINFMKNKVN